MKRLVIAAAAAALMAPGATGDTGSCLDLADPAGDVRVQGVGVPGGTANETDSVDLTGVRVEGTTGGAVTVTFEVAGLPEPRTGTGYEYRMEFGDDTNAYVLSADTSGTVRVPTSGSPYELTVRPHAGGGQEWTHSVSGTIDTVAGRIVVAADTRVLYDMDPGRTFTIAGFGAYAGPAGLPLGPLDTLAGPHTLVVGDACP